MTYTWIYFKPLHPIHDVSWNIVKRDTLQINVTRIHLQTRSILSSKIYHGSLLSQWPWPHLHFGNGFSLPVFCSAPQISAVHTPGTARVTQLAVGTWVLWTGRLQKNLGNSVCRCSMLALCSCLYNYSKLVNWKATVGCRDCPVSKCFSWKHEDQILDPPSIHAQKLRCLLRLAGQSKEEDKLHPQREREAVSKIIESGKWLRLVTHENKRIHTK